VKHSEPALQGPARPGLASRRRALAGGQPGKKRHGSRAFTTDAGSSSLRIGGGSPEEKNSEKRSKKEKTWSRGPIVGGQTEKPLCRGRTPKERTRRSIKVAQAAAKK